MSNGDFLRSEKTEGEIGQTMLLWYYVVMNMKHFDPLQMRFQLIHTVTMLHKTTDGSAIHTESSIPYNLILTHFKLTQKMGHLRDSPTILTLPMDERNRGGSKPADSPRPLSDIQCH